MQYSIDLICYYIITKYEFNMKEGSKMSRSKNINLFLMDGDASGRIKRTLANWTGVAYKIPRTEIEKCKNREDLKWSGVYFLFGVSDDTGENIAYIGQAGIRKNGEGILYRLMEHKRNPDKDYWTEAVVFTTSNNSFGPTEISYLENRFCNLAIAANRYTVKNSNDPCPGHITEEKESELEEFVDYAQLVMGTLGHKIFVPLTTTASVNSDTNSSDSEEPDLFLTRKIQKINFTVEATAKQTSEGFVVLKGSKIAPSSGTDDTISPGNLKKRKESRIESDILQEDVLFNSPSSAAEFVTGKSANGWVCWKNKEGKTLDELSKLTSITDDQ